MKKLTDKDRARVQNTGIRTLRIYEPWQQIVLAAVCTNCGRGEIADELPMGWATVDAEIHGEDDIHRLSGPRILCDECTDAPVLFVIDNDIPF
tara:strand:+ start:452 stop:730 length:279 start_codon:yes stop_codon:yes gene_type:complete